MEGFVIGFALAIILCALLPNTAVTKEEWEPLLPVQPTVVLIRYVDQARSGLPL